MGFLLYKFKCSHSTDSQYSKKFQKLGERMQQFGSKAFSVLLVLLIVRALVAQGQSTECTSTFFSSLVQLIPCRLSVAPFSPIPPSDACCSALKSLGQPCLCVLVNGPPISGVDRNMALQLPEKCTVSFEPCDIMK